MTEKSEAYKQGYLAIDLMLPDCPYDFVKENELFHEWCDGYDQAMRDEAEGE